MGYTNFWKSKSLGNSKNKQTFLSHLSSAQKKGNIPDSWLAPLTELIARESGWSSTAKNPSSTAYGYGQFLDSTRANYKKSHPKLNYSNPVDQIVLTAQYVKDRYGNPAKALQFWDKNNWY